MIQPVKATVAALGVLIGIDAAPASGLHDPWDRILRDVVHGERVDYVALRDEHLDALDRYLDAMASAEPSRMDRSDALAYWINLYNAAMVREVVRHDLDGWSPADDDFEAFDRPWIRTPEGTRSLDRIEHDIIRERFDDPRIHVAVVCAAASCPPLLPRAYRGDDLDRVLDASMERFLTSGRRNRIEPSTRTLHLSRIFDWYADDFGGRDALPAYVDRWVEPDVADWDVRFLDYDWSLNGVTGITGRPASPSGAEAGRRVRGRARRSPRSRRDG